ncbi:MAG: hypothetical protein QM764_02085 [Chitinophagaceae bacterium]
MHKIIEENYSRENRIRTFTLNWSERSRLLKPKVTNERQSKCQHDESLISFKIGHAPFSATSSVTPQQVAEKGLQYFETEDKLYKLLQDWNADDLLNIPFVRMRAVTQGRNDQFRVRIIYFKATFQDDY